MLCNLQASNALRFVLMSSEVDILALAMSATSLPKMDSTAQVCANIFDFLLKLIFAACSLPRFNHYRSKEAHRAPFFCVFYAKEACEVNIELMVGILQKSMNVWFKTEDANIFA